MTKVRLKFKISVYFRGSHRIGRSCCVQSAQLLKGILCVLKESLESVLWFTSKQGTCLGTVRWTSNVQANTLRRASNILQQTAKVNWLHKTGIISGVFLAPISTSTYSSCRSEMSRRRISIVIIAITSIIRVRRTNSLSSVDRRRWSQRRGYRRWRWWRRRRSLWTCGIILRKKGWSSCAWRQAMMRWLRWRCILDCSDKKCECSK